MHFSAGTPLLLALIGLSLGAFGTLIGAGGLILTPILLLLYHTTPRRH